VQRSLSWDMHFPNDLLNWVCYRPSRHSHLTRRRAELMSPLEVVPGLFLSTWAMWFPHMFVYIVWSCIWILPIVIWRRKLAQSLPYNCRMFVMLRWLLSTWLAATSLLSIASFGCLAVPCSHLFPKLCITLSRRPLYSSELLLCSINYEQIFHKP
jgi:hypothetical protein